MAEVIVSVLRGSRGKWMFPKDITAKVLKRGFQPTGHPGLFPEKVTLQLRRIRDGKLDVPGFEKKGNRRSVQYRIRTDPG